MCLHHEPGRGRTLRSVEQEIGIGCGQADRAVDVASADGDGQGVDGASGLDVGGGIADNDRHRRRLESVAPSVAARPFQGQAGEIVAVGGFVAESADCEGRRDRIRPFPT